MNKERQIIAASNNNDNKKTKRITISKKKKWEEKQLYGYSKGQTSEILAEEDLNMATKGKPKERN